MSKEMLPRKLTRDQSLATGPSIVIETNKDNKKRGTMMFLLAIAVGAAALTGIALLGLVTFYNDIKSSSSIKDSDYGAARPADMTASLKATDGKGTVIEHNGMTESDEMTIADYSDGKYSTELSCSINLLPAYCSGKPVILSGLPPGEYTFSVVEPQNDQTAVKSFSWNILK